MNRKQPTITDYNFVDESNKSSQKQTPNGHQNKNSHKHPNIMMICNGAGGFKHKQSKSSGKSGGRDLSDNQRKAHQSRHTMGMKVNNYMVSENYGRSNSKKANKENVSPMRATKKKVIKEVKKQSVLSTSSNCLKKLKQSPQEYSQNQVNRRPSSGSGVQPFQHV